MKCTVISEFVDKFTGSVHAVGEVLDLDADRADHLVDAGAVEAGGEAVRTSTVADIKAELEAAGIDILKGAKKADLEELLEEAKAKAEAAAAAEALNAARATYVREALADLADEARIEWAEAGALADVDFALEGPELVESIVAAFVLSDLELPKEG